MSAKNLFRELGRRWLSGSRIRYTMLAAYLLALGFLSLNPWVRPGGTDDIFSPDKLAHVIAYAGLVILLYFSLASRAGKFRNCSPCAWMAALAISVLIGILIEIAQALFVAGRAGSVGDAVANTIGAMLGYAAFRLVKYFVPE
jgi:VanZ family protein